MGTTEEALREYLTVRGLIPSGMPRGDWYRDNWVRIQVKGRRVPVFPIHGFKQSFFLHDIHHLLTGYDTDWTGEFEIAAWELSSGGCGRYYLYWIDRIVFILLGLIFAPRATVRAFRQGWPHRNSFGRDPNDLMPVDFDELRRLTMPPASRGSAPLRKNALCFGVALYASASLGDTVLTLNGVGADLALEGNPIVRALMESFGALSGLVIAKAAIGTAAIAISVIWERAIREDRPWTWKIPASSWARRWMQKKDRSWIAFIPLYAAAIAQAFAVAGWLWLGTLG